MQDGNIAAYWKEKTEFVANAFVGWEKREEIQVRKLVIAQMMEIPEKYIGYYLKRDTWLLEFALGDDRDIDSTLIGKESIKRKVDSIIEICFYKEDYKSLLRIKGETAKDFSGKKEICDCIKDLLESETYERLTNQEKETLAIYEKIYFEQIELFNGYIEELVGKDIYYSILMEQWKTANEMATNISAQRNSMNNFYISMMSILIGGILFSDQFLGVNPWVRICMYIVIGGIGIQCCKMWNSQIENYKKMNGEKYTIINEIERNLPANVLLYEYKRTEQNARRNQNVINFSKKEEEIVELFKKGIFGVILIMLISTCWEARTELCNVIERIRFILDGMN